MSILRKPGWVLFVLALSAFAIGTAEFVMAGVLPNIAHTFSVTIATSSYLMTAYAVGVAVSAPVLAVMTLRLPRKITLIVLMILFVLGNVLSALSHQFDVLMAGRIISALCHGTFFGVGAVVAANVVAADKKGRAIALMFTGLTLANVLGVPMGAFIAEHLGWRSMFWMVSILGVLSVFGLMVFLPNSQAETPSAIKQELQAFKKPSLILSLFITALAFGGVFAAFSFVAPMMTVLSGFQSSSVSWLLLIFGVGLVLGNILGGRAADRNLLRALFVLMSLLAIVLFAFVFTVHMAALSVLTLFLLGVFGFAIVSPVQSQVMQAASGAPTLASAVNIAFFNVGIALGTYLASTVVSLGFSYASPSLVGFLLVILALGLQMLKQQRCHDGSA